jgi:hypothetical protein
VKTKDFVFSQKLMGANIDGKVDAEIPSYNIVIEYENWRKLEWRIGVSAKFFGSTIREIVAERMIPTQGYIPFPALEIAITLMQSFHSGQRRGGLGNGDMLRDTQVPFGIAFFSS